MPQRRCLLTGQRAEAETLLRFGVVAGSVEPDPAHRLPGRGLWLVPGPDAVATAVARGMFARAAKRKLLVPADLPARSVDAWMAHVAGQVKKARQAGLVLAEAAAAEGDPETDGALSCDAAVLGLGRLALKRTPLTRRAVADLALLARLRPLP
ncbi:MAG: DUF448 domain-containing protein [Ferrovibrio sp.]|uniref:DUF448 domain-containing protein n=1 Tax=Ferrovibrio sp. TaxID=1917215 RepID=UPI0026086811|nr:DUF448 domain-containing protein [Ferrovibrio sp.]MCW0233688.1 DUF448 domain-containing protein [Ferrovibrio sp.]